MGDGGVGEEKGRPFLSFTSLPFSLPSFPFSPETPDTQASFPAKITLAFTRALLRVNLELVVVHILESKELYCH